MTELERQMTLFEARLRNIEARLNISNPERPQYGSNHQGKKTKEVLIQEGFSLKQSYKPQTMTKQEKEKWQTAYDSWYGDLVKSDAMQESGILTVLTEIDKLLHPERK